MSWHQRQCRHVNAPRREAERRGTLVTAAALCCIGPTASKPMSQGPAPSHSSPAPTCGTALLGTVQNVATLHAEVAQELLPLYCNLRNRPLEEHRFIQSKPQFWLGSYAGVPPAGPPACIHENAQTNMLPQRCGVHDITLLLSVSLSGAPPHPCRNARAPQLQTKL